MERDQLENLSIFELRDFARKIGVFNPTVLKKNDLISAIQDVQTGKVKPHVAKTRQGRPPKEFGRLLSIFVPEDVLNIPTRQEKHYEPKELSYNFKFNCNLEKTEGTDTILYKGFLELLQTGEGLLRKRIDSSEKACDRCFIKYGDMIKYNLKEGDEIVCNAYFISEEKPLLCDAVVSINNENFNESNIERSDFEELAHSYAKRKINFEDTSLNSLCLSFGDTVFAYNENVNDFVKFATQFALINKNSFDKFIYLSTASKPDKYDLLRSFSDELYFSSYQEKFSNQQRTAFMAINRAKRLAEMGKNVCLIIQDILELASLDNNNPDCELQISKDILSSAKNMNNGSLTIICGFKEIGLPYMRHKITTTFALLETSGIKITNKGIDLKNSYKN